MQRRHQPYGRPSGDPRRPGGDQYPRPPSSADRYNQQQQQQQQQQGRRPEYYPPMPPQQHPMAPQQPLSAMHGDYTSMQGMAASAPGYPSMGMMPTAYMGMPPGQMMPAYYDMNMAAAQGMMPMMQPHHGGMMQPIPAGSMGMGMQARPYSPSMQQQPSYHPQSSAPGGRGDRRRAGDGGRRYDSDRQPSQRQSKDESQLPGGAVKEYPCRTLFIRNINYDTPEAYLREMVEKYGEIKRFFSLLEKRGMIFITYYDLRDAEKAKKDLQGADIYGRKIDVHFSFPKDEELTTKQCDGEKNQGTCILTVRDADNKSTLTTQEVGEMAAKFGEIKSLRENRRSTNNQIFLEFYDSRSCIKAVEEFDGFKLEAGGVLQARFAWDQPLSAREAIARKAAAAIGSTAGRQDGGKGPSSAATGASAPSPQLHSSITTVPPHPVYNVVPSHQMVSAPIPMPMQSSLVSPPGKHQSQAATQPSQGPVYIPPPPLSLNQQQAQQQQKMKAVTQPAAPNSMISASASVDDIKSLLSSSLSALTSSAASGAQQQSPEVLAQMSQLLQLLQQQQENSKGYSVETASSTDATGAEAEHSGAAPRDPRISAKRSTAELPPSSSSDQFKKQRSEFADKASLDAEKVSVGTAENLVSVSVQQQKNTPSNDSGVKENIQPVAEVTTVKSSLEQVQRLASLLLQPSTAATTSTIASTANNQ